MANSKKKSSKPSVKVRDLRPNKNPKGGKSKTNPGAADYKESYYPKIK